MRAFSKRPVDEQFGIVIGVCLIIGALAMYALNNIN